MKKQFLCTIMALCLFWNAFSAMAASFVLPSALQAVDDQAFLNCEGMTGVLTVPSNTRSIGARTFAGANLFALETEAGVGSVDANAFGDTKVCYILVRGKGTAIPAALGVSACYIFASPDSRAWENASVGSAEYIDPANLRIHNGFFYEIAGGGARLLCAVDNTVLSGEITIPAVLDGIRVVKIAPAAFYGCENIRVLNLPDGITVADGSLSVLTQTSVRYFKHDYSDAPASDFTYTVNDGKVTLTGYTGIADIVCVPAAIEGCPVTTIGQSAFKNSAVSEWFLPDSIETISDKAFESAALRSIRLPENDNLSLQGECFAYTGNLASIHLPDGLKEMSGRCFYYSGLESVHIPPKITSLGYAFAYCSKLSEVTFAEGKLEYLQGTFNYTALKKVTLPESLTRINPNTFNGFTQQDNQGFEIWMGSAVNNLPDLRFSRNKTFPDGAVIYAPEGSYAAEWADYYENYAGTLYNKVSYGGGGCTEFFGGVHDHAFVSDTVTLDTQSGLHMHKVLYACTRCGDEKSYDQPQPEQGCWRCEAKAQYGSAASIPADKFEFLDRYKLDGAVYYRIRLLADHNNVKAGHEALFMNAQLKIVTARDTINQLFKAYMYTGSGTLPWEYTETTSDYPSLEYRAELVSSLLENARENLSLSKTFIELDMCYEKLGSTAMAGLKLLWGDPSSALKSLKETVVPDMDALVTVMHILLLDKLNSSTEYDARHYTNSINAIVDSNGFIVCEKAEESLQAYANCLAMRQLAVDNSSGIIDEIAACENDFGVGVRNIMTMLKGAVGVDDNPYAKTGVLVTQTMYAAITSSDEGDTDYSGLIVKYVGDLAQIIANASKSSCLGTMVDIYKSGNFSLSQFMYVDGAMERYEKSYNAFCLNNSTPLYQAHDALAGA